MQYLLYWSCCAFSILLSLARRFWNQILIWVSVSCKDVANSNLRRREMYSPLIYSCSNSRVCSIVKVVRCLRSLFFLVRSAEKKVTKYRIIKFLTELQFFINQYLINNIFRRIIFIEPKQRSKHWLKIGGWNFICHQGFHQTKIRTRIRREKIELYDDGDSKKKWTKSSINPTRQLGLRN